MSAADHQPRKRVRPTRAEAADRHELVRRANIEAVFRTITERAPVSRNELIRLTGLSKPTVLALVAALQDDGLIRDATVRVTMPRAVGRIPVAYEPNPQSAYVVGVDLGGTKIAVALGALTGAALAKVEEATTTDGGAAVVRQIARLAREAAAQAGVAWSRVDAVSVGTPGVVNPDGTIRMADNVNGLDTVHFAPALRRSLRTDVRVENDVNMAALGELAEGVARGCSTFVLLAIGTGLGMGVVVDGQLVRGSRGAAGEVAFLPIGTDPASIAARRRGAFEVSASGSGVQDLVCAELDRHAGATILTRSSTARDVYAAAALGDVVGLRVVEGHAALVARAVLAVAALLDPEMVVLGGGIGANPLHLEPLRAAVAAICPWPVRVETSALGAGAGLVGTLHHARRSLPEIESARVSVRMQTGTPS